MVYLKLLYSSKEKPINHPCNQGFDEALQLLKTKNVKYEVIDTSLLSSDELYHYYMAAWIPSYRKRYKIRPVFGSKRRSGWLFGRGVPALLVYEEGKEHPVDVYPHIEGERLVTIKEFLEKLG